MRSNYTPSVNIIRDTDRDFFYIPTPNGIRIVSQLVDDFKKGIRSYNIVGSYGTGKSSFLLALEQSLKNVKPYFSANFISNQSFDCIKIVGSYQSFILAFAEELGVKSKSNVVDHIFSEIFNRYHELGKKSPLLFIEVDEFGKFLEFASQNNPEKELYFIQQLAEFVNNPKYNIVLITTIHQSFESYAFSLSSFQRQEWAKVKGRFREIPFNEPVEQLFYLKKNKSLGIPLHLQNTKPTHMQGRAIRCNLFAQLTKTSRQKGFSLLSLMRNTVTQLKFSSTNATA